MAYATVFSNCDINLNIIRGRSKQVFNKSLQKFGQSWRHTHSIHYEKKTAVLHSQFVNKSLRNKDIHVAVIFFFFSYTLVVNTRHGNLLKSYTSYHEKNTTQILC